jgi:hypothetical protein
VPFLKNLPWVGKSKQFFQGSQTGNFNNSFGVGGSYESIRNKKFLRGGTTVGAVLEFIFILGVPRTLEIDNFCLVLISHTFRKSLVCEVKIALLHLWSLEHR